MRVLDLKPIVGILGALLFFLGFALLLPMLVALGDGDTSWWAFGISALIGFVVGGSAWWFFRPTEEFGVREGFVIVLGKTGGCEAVR